MHLLGYEDFSWLVLGATGIVFSMVYAPGISSYHYIISGKPITLDNDMLRAEVDVNPYQTIEELSNTMNLSRSTIQEHLRQTGIFSVSKCTIDLNLPELQYLSDHLTQEECHQLVAALHFQTYDVPHQVAAAEAGEGKGGTHVEVCHRLNQIGRRDLAQWLSKTVFHELSKDLDDSLVFLVTEETTRRATRVVEHRKEPVKDEAPWLNLDSVLAFLVILAVATCGCGLFYLLCLCGARIQRTRVEKKYERMAKEQARGEKAKREQVQMNKRKTNLPQSDDEESKLIPKKRSHSPR